jgi:hypothetical protein
MVSVLDLKSMQQIRIDFIAYCRFRCIQLETNGFQIYQAIEPSYSFEIDLVAIVSGQSAIAIYDKHRSRATDGTLRRSAA